MRHTLQFTIQSYHNTIKPQANKQANKHTSTQWSKEIVRQSDSQRSNTILSCNNTSNSTKITETLFTIITIRMSMTILILTIYPGPSRTYKQYNTTIQASNTIILPPTCKYSLFVDPSRNDWCNPFSHLTSTLFERNSLSWHLVFLLILFRSRHICYRCNGMVINKKHHFRHFFNSLLVIILGDLF